jgi:hypothetical protein
VKAVPLVVRLVTPRVGLTMPHFVTDDGRVWCLAGVQVAFGGVNGLPGVSGTR